MNYQATNYQSTGQQHPGYQPPGYQNPAYPTANYTPDQSGTYPSGYPQPGMPTLLDPALLRSARHIYRSFYEAHPDVTQRPIGVALNRYNYRGKLIFGRKPILLPQECFIPLEHIQAELY